MSLEGGTTTTFASAAVYAESCTSDSEGGVCGAVFACCPSRPVRLSKFDELLLRPVIWRKEKPEPVRTEGEAGGRPGLLIPARGVVGEDDASVLTVVVDEEVGKGCGSQEEGSR